LKSKSVFFVLALLCLRRHLLGDEGHHHLGPDEKMGNVSFPTSCAAAVQKPFERGVALMHSFEYELAEAQFKDVSTHDPGCASQCGVTAKGTTPHKSASRKFCQIDNEKRLLVMLLPDHRISGPSMLLFNRVRHTAPCIHSHFQTELFARS
jgi:hypothetical protein